MLRLPILLLSILVTSGAKCPSMCTCRHMPREPVPTSYLYYSVVKCKGFLGTNVTLTNTTRILEVTSLQERHFDDFVNNLLESDLPELNNIALTHSVVSNVSAILSVIGDKLTSLTLNYNNISQPPDLSGNVNLNVLDLAFNAISKLSSADQLSILRTLEVLNLSGNVIKQIATDTFRNLSNLKLLDLSGNKLTSLNGETFGFLSSLQYLNLSRNYLGSLKDSCFSNLSRLQQLDISWNNLARIAPGSLQLPSLTRLLLEGNVQLGNSNELIVEVGKRLHTVDASRIGLKQVPPALTQSIRTLRLVGNSIRTVTCGELDAYPLLQFLDCTSNDLVSIEEDALGRQESLSVLYLSDNKLESIPRSLPEELTVLHLENNVVRKVSKDDLGGLSNLEVLLLNDNKIVTIEGGAFARLRSLVTLDLSRNFLKALFPGVLSGPRALQILRLSGIDTVAPAEEVSFPLLAPDNLVSLDLSQSAGLARQFLADFAALAASRQLQELDISGADLEFIRSDLLHFLPELRIVHVQDNRLNCSELGWLAVWMRRQDRTDNRKVTCASPAELRGTPLVDLQYVEISTIKQINRPKDPAIGGRNYETKKSQDNRRLVTANEATNEGKLTRKRVTGEDEGVIKSASKTLVSGADLRLSSLIPLSNERKEDFATIQRGRNQPDLITATTTIGQRLSRERNGTTAVLNKSRLSLNLTSNERTFEDTSAGAANGNKSDIGTPPPPPPPPPTEHNMTGNASTIKTSMYRNEETETEPLHPGMLILALGLLCGTATLATLACRFNKRRNRNEISDDIIPVNSISSVTELW